ncbi:MAG: mechanosensitive ion channel family protein [Myxococcales bacterium]|nr:mechanosensitive ion channel family protein [Myxococcales bacterium]
MTLDVAALELLSHLVEPGSLTAGLIVAALLVNRFAMEHRRQLRRVVLLYGLYLTSWLVAAVARSSPLGALTWIEVTTDLLLAFTVVNLAALLVFDLLLPALAIEVLTIVSDLALGVAYVFAAAVVFSAAHVDVTSVVAASSIAAAVVTLSLQSTLGNVIGGIALQMDGSVQPGDWIQLENGKQGKVTAVRWRHTVVETRDWDTIIVPNASLLSSQIVILGKREGKPVQHRMWVYFHVDYRWAPTLVSRTVQDALRASELPNVSNSPPPDCICMDFARDRRESFGLYAVRYWLTDLAVDDPTSAAVRARVYSALRRGGIELAKPSMMVFHAPADDEDALRTKARREERALQALRRVELFARLTDEECQDLADHLVHAPFTAGETLTHQGAVAHYLYIVVEGRVDVVTQVTPDGPSRVVATIEGPGFIGEMGLMTGESRLASVVAQTDIECYRLDKPGFEKVLQDRPALAAEFSEILARRRVELLTVREGLDAASKSERQLAERDRILDRIRVFFGLED